ncbi:MAG: mannitol-specific PTS transporter subunit IIC, partial [Peptostreptococcus sp.]|nr:mannitol-specific PTS transporter subunit IIC [Peptostreptococcus sp.]
KKQSSAKTSVQKFGRFLSGMVMPNIGAFIAWGFITALFIPTGYLPNESLAKIVGPALSYLLPILIAYQGGKMVGGDRGAIMGSIATIGVIVGSEIPMLLGAMIMGPLGGFVIKKFDQAIDGKVKVGLEMLVNNFSIGIIGMLLAIVGFYGIWPIIGMATSFLEVGVKSLVNANLLPLVSIFIEPGKILFLNNAINHGVLTPLGINEAKEVGRSIMFLLEANPGPGLGILLAYCFFGKGNAKQSAPGAVLIHFIGGIHEIYFPYVLMNPALLIAVIIGGMSGVFTNVILGSGLVAPASPGSILAVMAMTAKGYHLQVIISVLVSTVVSFVIGSVFVKRQAANSSDEDIAMAQEKMK